ncbi:MAG: glycoside hydrolase family 3 protein, partial [Deltaproteobacteria bacterium]|nr:glycoside hydrolase family 3 protein [Deltaproteobacteria bacterium]
LIGVDAVHGHNNLVGAVIFPHNIGLGAARDPELAGRIASATAESMAATGMNWNFAPTLAVPRDARWGRTYEGFGGDPALVASYAGPVVRGYQGDPGQPVAPDRVAATAKHFLGDGGTDQGTDQGDTRLGEAELIEVHAQAYRAAIDAGVLTVMASFSAWNGEKMHGNRSLLTDVLKSRMGFQGLVVGDWNGHEQLPGCRADSCPEAFHAGIDIFMAPTAWKGLFDNLLEQVESGEIRMERLDDAVRRILRVKAKLGLLDGARPPVDASRFSTPEHRALAREAVQKSLVLLKNEGALPIDPAARVLVTGPAADDIATACGGWTITWQGDRNTNEHFPNGQSIASALDEALERAEISTDGTFTTKPDVAVVVFGESPYTEGKGDVKNLEYGPRDPLRILRALQDQGIRTVAVLLSGRPLQVEAEIAASDAFVAAWLPGSEGGGVADVLLGKADFSGRLPHPWPGKTELDRPFEADHGLRYR